MKKEVKKIVKTTEVKQTPSVQQENVKRNTFKVRDQVIRSLLLKMDKALRERTKFVNGKGQILKPAKGLGLSKNSIPFAEKEITTQKGNTLLIRMFLNNKNSNVNYAYEYYKNKEGKLVQSKNNFFVCDTSHGRDAYIRRNVDYSYLQKQELELF